MGTHPVIVGCSVACAVLVLTTAAALKAGATNSNESKEPVSEGKPAPSCHLEMTRAQYGFQCLGSAFSGSTLEPVSFVGTVTGDGKGFFESFGTYNSSNGSASVHLAGHGTLPPRCIGHVDYTTTEIVLPNGSTIPLSPISFDYTVVHGGDEILGAGVAPAGVTGDPVPRLACRLVRTR
jgi:hypothetical protein